MTPNPPPSRARLATWALGGLLGGLVGGFVVVGVTLALKAGLDYVSRQPTSLVIVVPLVGLAITAALLHGVGRSGPRRSAKAKRLDPWRTFRPGAVRADITGDVIDTAGEEEKFPWRLAPLRSLAVFATVGLGGAMGTEAPAAYFGAAAGASLGDHGRWWRRLVRPATLGGGAAGVSALMGIPLVGSAYLLELGARRRAPFTVERVLASLIGGIVGWAIDVVFGLSLIRLVVPREPPHGVVEALATAFLIGTLSGVITGLTGLAIYRAKKWRASPWLRVALGGLAAAVTAILLVLVAAPSAAMGPGGGAILWAEQHNAAPTALLAVALLRGVATTAATAAGGCGGIFVPFLAVGDLSGRVIAPGIGCGLDLAGSAGAAGGIAGGYRLPITAVAMVLGYGGPLLATLTCLATVAVAYAAAEATERVVDKLKRVPRLASEIPAH